MPHMAQHPHGQIRSPRTPSDVTVLLLELDRALRSQLFYPEGHGERQAALERGWLAWKADLDRHGPLVLEIRDGCFWLAGTEIAVGRGRLDELARELSSRGVGQLRWAPPMEAADFARAVGELVHRSPDADARVPSPPSRRRAADPVDQPRGVVGRGLETAAPALRRAGRAPIPEPSPPGAGPEATRVLGGLLRELEALDESDEHYGEVCRQIAAHAELLLETGHVRECLAAARLLCRHAGDDEKRSFEQQAWADRTLRSLVQGPLLADILDRAASAESRSRLEGAQILLRLGSPAVPDLIGRLAAESDPARRRRLGEIVVSLAEVALPALVHLLQAERDPERVRLAVRLAGECQHPDAVTPLQRRLAGAPLPLRREIIRALGQIGSAGAVAALANELRNDASPELARPVVGALAATGRAHAVAPLARTVERALRGGALENGVEAVRALGQLGSPSAVAALGGILSRRSLWRRRRLRALQLAAVASLARLPAATAAEVLRCGVRTRDSQVRRAVRVALERAESPEDGDGARLLG